MQTSKLKWNVGPFKSRTSMGKWGGEQYAVPAAPYLSKIPLRLLPFVEAEDTYSVFGAK